MLGKALNLDFVTSDRVVAALRRSARRALLFWQCRHFAKTSRLLAQGYKETGYIMKAQRAAEGER